MAKRVAQPGSQPDRRQAGLAGSLRAGALRRPVTSTLSIISEPSFSTECVREMKKKTFEVITALAFVSLLAPLAWHVHHTYSLRIQSLFLSIVILAAYALRKLFLEPIKSKLPD